VSLRGSNLEIHQTAHMDFLQPLGICPYHPAPLQSPEDIAEAVQWADYLLVLLRTSRDKIASIRTARFRPYCVSRASGVKPGVIGQKLLNI